MNLKLLFIFGVKISTVIIVKFERPMKVSDEVEVQTECMNVIYSVHFKLIYYTQYQQMHHTMYHNVLIETI